ncbi:MAG: hypothetical protein J0I99_04195 [Devosia sp.]|nr:hypothetical protein [Devosia sp.]
MPQLNTSLVDEARAAARGLLALLVGDRGASRYFSFSRAGLAGSFIALLLVTAIELVATAALGGGGMFGALVQQVIVYGAVVGASALYLRQIGRNDALVPFVVTLNWSNAILSLAMLATILLGLTVLSFVFLIAGIVLSINIGRVVMTLRPMQIVLLIIAQAVGLVAALLVLVMLFPPSAEDLAAIAAAARG